MHYNIMILQPPKVYAKPLSHHSNVSCSYHIITSMLLIDEIVNVDEILETLDILNTLLNDIPIFIQKRWQARSIGIHYIT
jgi:hypothetical protein